MRIISGSARGTRLSVPNNGARPTGDRVREALFSMIHPALRDARVLDLYAGSGAFGIEALSRGAESGFFIDSSGLAIKTIERNLERTRLREEATVMKAEVLVSLGSPRLSGGFDFIFADPPYDSLEAAGLVASELVPSLLRENGYLIVECPSDGEEIVVPSTLTEVDRRRYGAATLLFFQTSD